MTDEEIKPKMDWSLKIRRVSNGWILEAPNDNDVITEEVIQEEETEEGELEAGKDMLLAVADYFGLLGSRHDKKRIRVVLEPGEKYSRWEDE